MPIRAPRILIAPLALACLLASCSFDYESTKDPEALEESIPNSIQVNYEHTVVENGKPLFGLRAARAEYFASSKEIRLYGVSFAEFSKTDGKIITTGRADKGVYHTDSKDAEFSGAIAFQSTTTETRLSADNLAWDDKNRVLVGSSDGRVSLSKDDGSWVSGRGFRADARSKSFSFSGYTEGYLVDEEGAP